MKEQQKLGIQNAMEEETEGKRNKGKQGNKAGLWLRWRPEKMEIQVELEGGVKGRRERGRLKQKRGRLVCLFVCLLSVIT